MTLADTCGGILNSTGWCSHAWPDESSYTKSPLSEPGLEVSTKPGAIQGESEKFVDELLFNSYYILMASKDDSKMHLLAPSITIEAKATNVKVYFDSTTQKPYRIEGFSEGDGSFNPIAGHFTNWLDFYGANLILRVRVLAPSQALSFATIKNFSFTTENNYWRATARFSSTGEIDTIADRPGSIVIVDANWKTLGAVPNDFPSERLPSYGPLNQSQ